MAAAQSQVVQLCSTALRGTQKSIIVIIIGNEIKHTKNKTSIALHCMLLYHVIIHEYNVTNK